MIINKSPSGREAILTGPIASFDGANVPAASVVIQSIPSLPCVPGDVVLVRPRTGIANLLWGSGSCTVAGTALVPVVNPTAGAIDPAAVAYDYVVIRTSVE